MSDLQKSESEFSISEKQTPDLEFLKFFDPTTMSIHLKENQKPLGKKGMPGSFELVELDTKTLDRDYLEIMTNQILSAIDDETLGNTEISKGGTIASFAASIISKAREASFPQIKSPVFFAFETEREKIASCDKLFISERFTLV